MILNPLTLDHATLINLDYANAGHYGVVLGDAIQLGPNGNVSQYNALIDARNDTLSAVTSTEGFRLQIKKTAGTSTLATDISGLRGYISIDDPDAVHGYLQGLAYSSRFYSGTIGGAGGGEGRDQYGGVLYAQILGTPNTRDLYGDLVGLECGAFIQSANSTVHGDMYGARIQCQIQAGTVTGISYNLYLNRDGALTYGIYQKYADPNWFAGTITSPNFISNVAIGTSPYACTSTTVNTNLNADLLDGHHSGDFLTSFTETDPLSVHLNQSSPQTMSGGAFAGSGLIKLTSGLLGVDTNTYLTSVTAHNVLSATHGDTLADSVVKGDILYGNATPKWARFAANTTATKKFLNMTSSVPSWDALGTGDIPDLSGTYLKLAGGTMSGDIQVSGTVDLGKTGSRFANIWGSNLTVDNLNLDGNAIIATTGNITLGAAANTILTILPALHSIQGNGCTVTGQQSVGIGTGSTVSGNYSTSFGVSNSVTGNNVFVAGNSCTGGAYSNVIGYNCYSSSQYGLVLGNAVNDGNGSAYIRSITNYGAMAIGFAYLVGDNDAIIESSGYGSIAMGTSYSEETSDSYLRSSGFGSITMGYSYASHKPSYLQATNGGSIAMGWANANTSTTYLQSTGNGAVAIGYAFGNGTEEPTYLQATGRGSIALGMADGYTLEATGEGAVAIGTGKITGHRATGIGSVVLGTSCWSTYNYGIVIGRFCRNTTSGSFTVGFESAGYTNGDFQVEKNKVQSLGNFYIADAKNIILGTTTGTKIGTGTTQLIGFWNTAPAVQPTHIADADITTVVAQFNSLLLKLETIGILASA